MVSASHNLMFPLSGVKTLIDRRTRWDTAGQVRRQVRDIFLREIILPKQSIALSRFYYRILHVERITDKRKIGILL